MELFPTIEKKVFGKELRLGKRLMIKLRGPPPAEKKEDDDDEKRSPARHEDIERGLSGWEKGREA